MGVRYTRERACTLDKDNQSSTFLTVVRGLVLWFTGTYKTKYQSVRFYIDRGSHITVMTDQGFFDVQRHDLFLDCQQSNLYRAHSCTKAFYCLHSFSLRSSVVSGSRLVQTNTALAQR